MARQTKHLADHHLLIVEDEAFLARQLSRFLRGLGATFVHAPSVGEARELLRDGTFDYILLDVNLTDGRGLDLLADGSITPDLNAIVMTSEGSLEVVIEAMRLGAVDFLCKPFDLEEVPLAIERVADRRRSERRDTHRQAQAERESEGLFFGERLEIVRSQVDRILVAERKLAGNLPPVLIEGETGVGKTTLARWVHRQGPRGGKEMIEINCATLPEALAESELFGHEKGAFTDARETRIGLFEAADGSTLFLDEIASLPLPIQAKLLTVLEDGAIRRVGGKRQIPVDVRIIGASLRNLRQLVEEGKFREDLMHRLDLLRLRVPPLRDCPNDLPALAQHLLGGLARRYGMDGASFSETGLRRLRHYEWPGNLRELAHEIERSLILEDPASISLQQLGASVGDADAAAGESGTTTPKGGSVNSGDWLNPAWALPESGFSVEQVVLDFIELALRECDGNLSAAARRLGVPRDFVRYRLKKKD